MDAWLAAAVEVIPPWVEVIPPWIEFQMRQTRQVGCVLAVAHHGEIVLERAFGLADLGTGEAMTPRHRFRVASHSKSFTAAGIMRLREQGRLGLDDAVGRYVAGLHPDAAAATIGQLLSHSAGLTRDGADSGQFADHRPFPDAAEVLADLAAAPPIPAGSRFKYSNHGYALLGLVIEAVTAEPFRRWIRREVVEAFGLAETEPDMPLPDGIPFARGHSGRILLGHRRVIPGDFTTRAIAPAGGFVATAADLVRFYAQLSPEAVASPLSAASRREMTRRHWRNPHAFFETHYGLGTVSGTLAGWDWVGHSGGLQGYISRACVVPAEGLAVAVLINGIDGLAGPWSDGVLHILRAFAQRCAPVTPALRDWSGRWWGLWGAFDLVPAGKRVLVTNPAFWNPMMDASEIEVLDEDHGRIVLAGGYGSHGEPARLVRDAGGAWRRCGSAAHAVCRGRRPQRRSARATRRRRTMRGLRRSGPSPAGPSEWTPESQALRTRPTDATVRGTARRCSSTPSRSTPPRRCCRARSSSPGRSLASRRTRCRSSATCRR
jgi:CubicO group peptidase (beta-lactamase class C family)